VHGRRCIPWWWKFFAFKFNVMVNIFCNFMGIAGVSISSLLGKLSFAMPTRI
jgi:hypothetical protein